MWKRLPHGTLAPQIVSVTSECLKDTLRLHDCITQVQQTSGKHYRLIPPTPPKQKGAKQVDRRGLSDRLSTMHGVTAWVVVCAPERGGVAYGVLFATEHPHNLKLASQEETTALEVVHKAIQEVPGDVPLAVVCHTRQCHLDKSIKGAP